MKVLAVQNIEVETLGALGQMLRSDGYEIDVVNAPAGDVPETLGDHRGVVILGGPMAVYDRLGFLQQEQSLIKSAIESQVPVLGICLGSQLIAEATGGRVFKGSRKEIGWHDVMLTSAGSSDVFRGIDEHKPMRVFQWHGDTYELPANAKILAKSELYPQAFRVGSAIGIQFHIEVNSQMIKQWTLKYGSELRSEQLSPDDVLTTGNRQEELESICRVVYRNFAATLRTSVNL